MADCFEQFKKKATTFNTGKFEIPWNLVFFVLIILVVFLVIALVIYNKNKTSSVKQVDVQLDTAQVNRTPVTQAIKNSQNVLLEK